MNHQKRLILILTLALMAGTAGAVVWLKAHKRLGHPGIKSTPTTQSVVVSMDLPANVLDFTSTNLPQEQIVLDYLPDDTSFARRQYTAPDGFSVAANVILMGTDRTSIHKPDYCLAGSGFAMDRKAVVNIPIDGPHPYELEVAKWSVSGTFEGPNGQKQRQHGLYVFWFVADGEMTPSYRDYKLWFMWDLLHTGVLQRWAYVSYFVQCDPGGEDAAFERVKKLIAASVPEFQLPPKAARAATVAQQ